MANDDTPRTNLEEWIGDLQGAEAGIPLVHSGFARALERELMAALDRVGQLERELDRARDDIYYAAVRVITMDSMMDIRTAGEITTNDE
jgi:hypothetical protein